MLPPAGQVCRARPRIQIYYTLLKFTIDFALLIDSALVGSTSLKGVPRWQKMLKGHLPRAMYHQVYKSTKIEIRLLFIGAGADGADFAM